jgi:hypothetical protein
VRRAGLLVEVARLLHEPLPRVERPPLALLLVPQRAFQRADRVEVLDLDLGPERLRSHGARRDVRIAPERALLHPHVRNAERLERRAELHQVRPSLLRRVHVGIALDLEVPADADRQVVLADLVVLGHVRIEVVLPVEQRLRSDLAVQGEADAGDVLDRLLVRDREGSGQAQAHRAHARVRRGPELVAASAEHLRLGRELDVALQTDHGFVRGHDARSLSNAADLASPSHARRTAGVPSRGAGRLGAQSNR